LTAHLLLVVALIKYTYRHPVTNTGRTAGTRQAEALRSNRRQDAAHCSGISSFAHALATSTKLLIMS